MSIPSESSVPSSAAPRDPPRFIPGVYNGHGLSAIDHVVAGKVPGGAINGDKFRFSDKSKCSICGLTISKGSPACDGPKRSLVTSTESKPLVVPSQANTHPASVRHEKHGNHSRGDEKRPKDAPQNRGNGSHVNRGGDHGRRRPWVPENAKSAEKRVSGLTVLFKGKKLASEQAIILAEYLRVRQSAHKRLADLMDYVKILDAAAPNFTINMTELMKGDIAVSSNDNLPKTKESTEATLVAELEALELDEESDVNDSTGGSQGIEHNVNDSNRSTWGDDCEKEALAPAEASLH